MTALLLVCVTAVGLLFSAGLPPYAAASEDKLAEKTAVDPRLQPLIGTWEGRVRFAASKSDESRTLVIEDKDGQLRGRYGVTGKGLAPVDLSTAVVGSRVQVRFQTGAGNNVTLDLARDNWLTGTFVVTSGRSGGSAERPIDLERKK
jgi:hypothetical protein